VAGMAHRSFSDPPETLSPSFSPVCPWIHGLFPTIEFAVVPSSSLPNFGDPGATLAHARLNSGDLTAVERSGVARSRLFPRSDPLRPIQIERPGPHVRLTPWPASQRHPQPLILLGLIFSPSDLDRTARTPSDPCSHPFPLWRWARSVSALSPSIADTPCPACQRSHARALGHRSNHGCRFLIQRLDSPDTPSRGCFA
jgi:hypothetical protein